MTVATIDRKVGLSTEQADQLIAAILPDWNDREDSAMVLQETEMIPQIPNSVVTKIFTDTQMRIWNLLPKSGANRVNYLPMYDAFDEHAFDLSLLDPRFSKKPAPGKGTGANQPSPKTPVPAP